MNTANFADAASPDPGKHVYFTVDGKTQVWATIVAVNKDGTLDLNVHDKSGHITQGCLACKQADGMNHSVPKTWWV